MAEHEYHPLTLAELRLKTAQLAERAERLRQRQRETGVLSPTQTPLGHAVRTAERRSLDYARLLCADTELGLVVESVWRWIRNAENGNNGGDWGLLVSVMEELDLGCPEGLATDG